MGWIRDDGVGWGRADEVNFFEGEMIGESGAKASVFLTVNAGKVFDVQSDAHRQYFLFSLLGGVFGGASCAGLFLFEVLFGGAMEAFLELNDVVIEGAKDAELVLELGRDGAVPGI